MLKPRFLVLDDLAHDAAGRDEALRAYLVLAQAWMAENHEHAELWAVSEPAISLPIGMHYRPMPVADDPGARHWLALCLTLAASASPLLIRSSCTGVSIAHLRQAQAALERHDAVFLSTLRGDYALAGLSRAVPELFASLPWGTDQVMSATRARARKRGCKLAEFALVA